MNKTENKTTKYRISLRGKPEDLAKVKKAIQGAAEAQREFKVLVQWDNDFAFSFKAADGSLGSLPSKL